MIRWQMMTKAIKERFNLEVELTLSTQLQPKTGRYKGLGFISNEGAFYQIMLSSVLKSEEHILAVIVHELAHLLNILDGKDKDYNLVKKQKEVAKDLEEGMDMEKGDIDRALVDLNNMYGGWDK